MEYLLAVILFLGLVWSLSFFVKYTSYRDSVKGYKALFAQRDKILTGSIRKQLEE